jgi:hypothetical protein
MHKEVWMSVDDRSQRRSRGIVLGQGVITSQLLDIMSIYIKKIVASFFALCGGSDFAANCVGAYLSPHPDTYL